MNNISLLSHARQRNHFVLRSVGRFAGGECNVITSICV